MIILFIFILSKIWSSELKYIYFLKHQ